MEDVIGNIILDRGLKQLILESSNDIEERINTFYRLVNAVLRLEEDISWVEEKA